MERNSFIDAINVAPNADLARNIYFQTLINVLKNSPLFNPENPNRTGINGAPIGQNAAIADTTIQSKAAAEVFNDDKYETYLDQLGIKYPTIKKKK